MTARVLLQTCVFAATLLVPALVAQELPRIMVQTDLGSMEVELDTIGSPEAAGTFLSHVDQGAYQGGRFYRTVRAERLPGGKADIEGIEGELSPSISKSDPPVALNGKKDSGLGFADKGLSLPEGGKEASAPDFFIRVGDHPELGRLDPNGGGFTAFGRVVRGNEVVRLIQTARSRDGKLTPPVGIVSITRVQ